MSIDGICDARFSAVRSEFERNFAERGDPRAKETATALRNYWKTYGHLPFDARMMAILTDAKGDTKTWAEAAENLADRAALHVEVGAEPAQRLHAEGQVELVVLLELGLLRVGEHRVADLLGLHR